MKHTQSLDFLPLLVLIGSVASFLVFERVLGVLYIMYLIKKYNRKVMPKFHERLGVWVMAGWPMNEGLILQKLHARFVAMGKVHYEKSAG